MRGDCRDQSTVLASLFLSLTGVVGGLGFRLAGQGGFQTLQMRFAQGIRSAESAVSHRLAFSTAGGSGPRAIERDLHV